ncbi:hypothetical protein [Shimia biformata]|uniref:hypothetical protein n=1 Tax=Shimia biformata TaxID=1294299 RepID=UPI001950BC49|nr:hypothetical protein [Shimia biformata]
MRFALALAAAGTFASWSSVALAQTYICNFPRAAPLDSQHILPDQSTVTLDASGETATAHDPVIEIVHGGPIEVRVSHNTDKRLTVKWELERDKRVFYTLSIYRPALNADIQLDNPPSVGNGAPKYGNDFQGAKGQCVER